MSIVQPFKDIWAVVNPAGIYIQNCVTVNQWWAPVWPVKTNRTRVVMWITATISTWTCRLLTRKHVLTKKKKKTPQNMSSKVVSLKWGADLWTMTLVRLLYWPIQFLQHLSLDLRNQSVGNCKAAQKLQSQKHWSVPKPVTDQAIIYFGPIL